MKLSKESGVRGAPVDSSTAAYASGRSASAEAYMVLGLNTVCDVYFAGSIDVLCDAFNLTPDVAGAAHLQSETNSQGARTQRQTCGSQATWMAAGGSAPEFFASMIGATIAPALRFCSS